MREVEITLRNIHLESRLGQTLRPHIYCFSKRHSKKTKMHVRIEESIMALTTGGILLDDRGQIKNLKFRCGSPTLHSFSPRCADIGDALSDRIHSPVRQKKDNKNTRKRRRLTKDNPNGKDQCTSVIVRPTGSGTAI